jgi:hypothetical protein
MKKDIETERQCDGESVKTKIEEGICYRRQVLGKRKE